MALWRHPLWFQGGYGLRNEEGRRKWSRMWTFLTRGYLGGKGAKEAVGSGPLEVTWRDLGASVLMKEPMLLRIE